MADEFEEGLKDLVSEQFRDGEVAPLRNETTGELVDDENAHDENVGDREKAAEELEEVAGDEDADEEIDEDTDEEVDEEETAGDEDTDDIEDDKSNKKPKGRYEKRIGSLTATVRRLERELKDQRVERERAAAVPKKSDGTPYTSAEEYAKDKLVSDQKAPKKPSAGAKGEDGKPLYALGEFDDSFREAYDDYLEARRDFLANARKEFEASGSAHASAAAAETQQEFATKLDTTIANGRKLYKDFDEKVVKGVEKDTWALSQTGAEFMVDSEIGPDIAYHLASNTKLAKEIANLPPMQQIKRLVKLENEIAGQKAEREKKAKRGSSAPSPLRERARGGGSRDGSRFDSDNFEDVERNWNSTQKRRH